MRQPSCLHANSWLDGTAFAAIVSHYRPDLVDMATLDTENRELVAQKAFFALKEIGFPPFMTAEGE